SPHGITSDFPKVNIHSRIPASPVPETAAVPWLLGTSGKSAMLAAEKGLPYVFGDFMSKENGPEIVRNYRKHFFENNPKQKPNAIVTVYPICATTTEAAEEIALSSHLWKIKHAKMNEDKQVPKIDEAKKYKYSEKDLKSIERLINKQLIGNTKEVKAQNEEI